MRPLSLLWLGAVPAAAETPVQRVTKLIQNVADGLVKEAKADEKTYNDLKCWCKRNMKAKTEAVAAARADAKALQAEIQSEAGKAGSYKAAAASAKEKHEKYETQFAEAEASHETEMSELRTEFKNVSEALAALKMAIQVIQHNHSLLQQSSEVVEALATVTHDVSEKYRIITGKAPHVSPSFLQASTGVMSKVSQAFSSTYQSQINTYSATKVLKAFLQQSSQESYAPQSGGILGILKNMDDDMTKDKAETEAEIKQKSESYEQLKATLTQQIAKSRKNFEDSTAAMNRAQFLKTNGKVQLEKQQAAATADAEVLADIELQCQNTDTDYAKRQKARQDEQAAVAKALEILNSDNNRGALMSFVQTTSTTQRAAVRALKDASNAVSSWNELGGSISDVVSMINRRKQLALLASQAKTTAPAALEPLIKKLETLIVETKETMKSDEAKKLECGDNLNVNAGDQRFNQQAIKNMNGSIEKTNGAIEKTVQKTEETNKALAAAQYSIVEVEQKREEENTEFQAIVANQNEVLAILRKVEETLRLQYGKVELVQAPGEVEAMPAGFGGSLKKNSAGTGIMAILSQIISDAEVEKKDAIDDEAQAQEDYENFVQAAQNAIAAHTESVADLMQGKADLEKNQEGNKKDLAGFEDKQAGLESENAALHTDCDFLLKYHSKRMEAMGQEVAGMTKAIAILSGANFGL